MSAEEELDKTLEQLRDGSALHAVELAALLEARHREQLEQWFAAAWSRELAPASLETMTRAVKLADLPRARERVRAAVRGERADRARFQPIHVDPHRRLGARGERAALAIPRGTGIQPQIRGCRHGAEPGLC